MPLVTLFLQFQKKHYHCSLFSTSKSRLTTLLVLAFSEEMDKSIYLPFARLFLRVLAPAEEY